MKLSVIVPVYNMAGEGKLAYCLDSLLAQRVRDFEIIAVNDASTDNSLDILKEYEANYPGRIRVLTYEVNRRQGGAKNAGLQIARGDWIGFVDSDDWVAPDCFEKLIRKGEETGADLVGCDYNLVKTHTMEVGQVVPNNTGDQTGILDEEKHKKLFLRPGSMVVKIYRHSVIRENRLDFPEGIFYEDNCAGSLWSLYFNHFERVDEPLYYYYQHSVSTVHQITEEKCRDRMRSAELLYEECEKRGFLARYARELEYRFTELYFLNTLFSYLSGVKRPKPSFGKALMKGLKERFPAFWQNPYYQEYTGETEKDFILLQQKSNLLFFCSYYIKHWIWSMHKSAEVDR